MTTPPLSQLTTGLTPDQILTSILAIAAELDLPTTAWEPDSVGREFLYIFSDQLSVFSAIQAEIASGGLLDYATGFWLTLLAYNNYNVSRIPATYGTTEERLTNTSATPYTINPGDLQFYAENPNRTYTNITGGLLAASSTLDIEIQADDAGTAGNAIVGEITGMQTPLQGVTATNLGTVVGTNEESDVSLRARCRESMAAASPNGPRDAYDYFAKTTFRADGSNAGVTRTAVTQGNATIIVYIASAAGAVETSDVALVNTNIQDNCVPTGFTATVVSASAVAVPITATVYLSQGSSLDGTAATALILTQLTSYFASVPIGGENIGLGGKIFLNKIIGQILNASDQFVQATVALPVADVSLNPNQVATLGALNITVVPNDLV